MIGYKNELERLQREKKDLTQSINNNKIKKENEIKEAQRVIEEKYDGLIQKEDRNLCETIGAIDFLKKKVVEFSEFKGAIAWNLICAMIDIIRVYEGKEYIVQDINYPVDGKSIYDTNKAYLIINNERKLNKEIVIHQLYEINIRVKEGNAIVLNWDAPYTSNINSFKFYDLKDHNIKHNASLGRFNYIKRFIDYIISYRLENGIIELTPEDIINLEKMFLRDNFYDIEEYHKYLTEKRERKCC